MENKFSTGKPIEKFRDHQLKTSRLRRPWIVGELPLGLRLPELGVRYPIVPLKEENDTEDDRFLPFIPNLDSHVFGKFKTSTWRLSC